MYQNLHTQTQITVQGNVNKHEGTVLYYNCIKLTVVPTALLK